MKAVLQRVESASVKAEGVVTGEIGYGYVILLGIGQHDNEETADKMIQKIKKLRIFPDTQGKTNLSIEDVQGEVLIISQFTLYADCRKGNRPSFIESARPERAEELYNYFIKESRPHFRKTAHGIFGAYMKVALVNDGPFTVALEM